MTTALHIGVQHSPLALPSFLIDLGTQASVPSGWVMGPRKVATHAFVVVADESGVWRLDGQPGGAKKTQLAVAAPHEISTEDVPAALWRVLDGDVHMGCHVAAMLEGTPYDWSEIAASAARAFAILPVLHKLQFIGRRDAFAKAMICTKVALNVMEACGGPPARAAVSLPDLYPERLGQTLRAAEGSWTTRVC